MVKRTYECNLCSGGDDVNPDNYLIGLRFIDGKLDQQVLSVTENHICRYCIRGLATLAAKLDPKWLEGK